MNEGEKKNRARMGLRLCVLLVVVLLLGAILLCFPARNIGFNNEEATFLDDGWMYVKGDGTRTPIELPADLDTPAGEAAVIEYVLPETLPPQSTICLRASMQSVRAYLDDELIYEFGTEESLVEHGDARSAWVMFRLPKASEGKVLHIELTSPYESFSGKISSIYCSSKAAILFDLAETYSTGFLVFAILVVIGAALLVLYLFAAFTGLKYPSLLYLALFSLIVGLWIFGESKTIQFFSGSEYFVSKLAYYALLAMPLPFTLYMDSAYRRHTVGYPVFFFWIFTANLVISVLLELTGIAPLFRTLIVAHTMILVLIVVTVSALAFETFRYHNREAREQLIGLCILGPSCALELTSMWSGSFQMISKFLRMGILIYVAYMGVSNFRRLLLLVRESREAEYFKRLALTDMVTGGNNRNAFENDEKKAFVHDGKTGNWLILFDLDRLKIINDSIGHQTGDEAIRLAYHCRADAFRGVGTCYRIGGDEFACIVLSTTEAKVDERLQKLNDLVLHIQSTVPFDFGISFGKGMFDPALGDFRTFFAEVDRNLYSNKEKKHQTPPLFL